MGGFHKWGYPHGWMVTENTNLKWMIQLYHHVPKASFKELRETPTTCVEKHGFFFFIDG
jgi:hypothetical protein